MPAMTSDDLRDHIATHFPGTNVMEDDGNWFFIYDPDRNQPPERQMPYATLVTSNRYDQASDLDRPGVYRLNVSMKKSAFQALLGSAQVETLIANADLTTLDTFVPHPDYGTMWWVCVLNPDTTFDTAMAIVADAYERAAGRNERRVARPSVDAALPTT